MNSTQVRWRVEYRLSFHAPWKKSGLYETRDAARATAAGYRGEYGFRNTRVTRFVKAGK